MSLKECKQFSTTCTRLDKRFFNAETGSDIIMPNYAISNGDSRSISTHLCHSAQPTGHCNFDRQVRVKVQRRQQLMLACLPCLLFISFIYPFSLKSNHSKIFHPKFITDVLPSEFYITNTFFPSSSHLRIHLSHSNTENIRKNVLLCEVRWKLTTTYLLCD